MSFFGTNIKKIRQVKGLSQKAFADLFDLNRGVISSYEEGRAEPKIDTIIKVAGYFNLDLNKFLTETLQVNQLVSVSDIDHLMFESDNTAEKPVSINYYRNGKEVDENVLQKILANVDVIYEYKSRPAIQSFYKDGDILFLSSEISDFSSDTVFLDKEGYLQFISDGKKYENLNESLYTITGHISIGNKNVFSDILSRLELLEKKVF
ncbi:helix-turn-helix domain-containing protein [Chryseobacterium profundimaris]|uniref:Transcriptional regulator, contains XRE-family HTH domain n=1 Tax=Chryseobacterium profundimaris TaxID=1387275 RepID=A0ABY1PHH5_9FLAO|nr:helix-turn-helix transcriptional regulator [Chryseobacterium profundimaris]SMP33757.1 Transcriptional regulator, contains XRE-family HTH domain [Chryseobacterium profundimaris]